MRDRPLRVVTAPLDIDTAADIFRELNAEWRQARGLSRTFPLLTELLVRPDLPRAAWLALWRIGSAEMALPPELASRVGHIARVPEPMPAEIRACLHHGVPALQEVRVGRMPEARRYERLCLPLSDDGAEASWLLTFGLPANPDLALGARGPEQEGRARFAAA